MSCGQPPPKKPDVCEYHKCAKCDRNFIMEITGQANVPNFDERIQELEKQIIALTDMYKHISINVASLLDHKIRQTDENRKSYNSICECYKRIEDLERYITHREYMNRKEL